ncbi:hypothetical protein KTS45_00360 [Halomicroarcula limicola]|uniref:Uncharacterized protein n=1 Tax=Haloarcula limicola TaxID=1429915 RepID=A0A8J7Y8D7_9EURY|nr:hypothetical protein [Halomicroarcula limicola]MBV0922641.1 hypothetical protein [Halomicroarcula limicola]
MSAVSLLDVYRYGTRFVGYFLVVSVVGGVFVGIGMVLGASSATSPTVETNRALLGVVVAGIGVLLTLSGLFGLAHKLVADATRVGAAAAVAATGGEPTADRAEDESGGETATTDETARVDSGETTDERRPADTAAASTGTAAGGAAATADEETSTRRSETQPPAEDPADPVGVNRPGQRRGGPGPAAATELETAEATRAPEQSRSAVAGADDRSAAERDSVPDQPTDADVDVPGEETTGDAPSSAATATETDDTGAGPTEVSAGDDSIFGGPTADAPSDATGEPTAREANEGNAPTPAERESPQEWSPPDPTEFESGESSDPQTADDAGGTADAAASDAADWGAEGTDATGDHDESTDGPRTTDDLFGEEPIDESDPFERAVGEETRTADSSDVTGADATDEVVADQSTDEDDSETAGSTRRFDVDSDGDPLSDALDDE